MDRAEQLKRQITATLEFQRGPTKRSGDELFFRCLSPEKHRNGDTSPSARWNEEKGLWYCDVCGAKGGYVDLARRLEILPGEKKATEHEDHIKSEMEAIRLLESRGITKQTQEHFQIKTDIAKQVWSYPVLHSGVEVAGRIKLFPGRKPKYLWTQKGQTFPIYGLDDIKGEREVWLVAGEPDLWICHQAGIKAIAFPFGEGTVPHGAVELLQEAGIETLNIVYDNDKAGDRGGQTVAKHLKEAGFEVSLRQLPEHLNEGGDLNDLYLSNAKDGKKFSSAVYALPAKQIKEEIMTEGIEKPSLKKINYLARFDALVDIVDHDGDLVYMVRNDGQISIIPFIEISGSTYYPPPREQLPYAIPRWGEVERAYSDDTPQALFDDVVKYQKKFSQLPSEGYYILLTAWDFSTYLLESLNYSGYIYLYAVPGRGKTKTGQSAIYVAYRGIHQENVREADLFRGSDDLGASLFIDVRDLWKKADRAGSDDILLLRFEQGATVRRVINPEKGAFKDSRFYEVYGATIVASNEPISEILESRSFPIIMPYSMRNYPKPTKESGLPLRERLVAWRARQLGRELPPPRELVTGRLNDIAAPLGQIIDFVSPRHFECFSELIREMDKGRKTEQASTREGETIKALIELKEGGAPDQMSVKSIVDKINEGKPEGRKVAPMSVGKILRRLNIKPAAAHAKQRCYEYDDELIKRLAVEYGVTEEALACAEKPSLPSQPSPHDWLQLGQEDTSDTSPHQAKVPALVGQRGFGESSDGEDVWEL